MIAVPKIGKAVRTKRKLVKKARQDRLASEGSRIRSLDADVDSLCIEILSRYYVVPDKVEAIACIDKHGVARYLIREPKLSDRDVALLTTLLDYVYTSITRIEDEDDLKNAVTIAASELGLEDELFKNFDKLWYYIKRDCFGYGVLDPLFRDDNIEDIELSHWRNPVTVVHRKFLAYEALTTNITFSSEEEVKSLIERLALKSGKAISLANPELHAALPEGFRIAATLGDPVSTSPTFDIRKFPRVPIDVVTLVREGCIDPSIAVFTWILNDAKMFYCVIGGSGTGKTTLLNALLQLSHPSWKIVVVQDIPEIKLPGRPRFIQLFGETTIEQFKRCTTALRYRPDILVVGEVRGREIRALVRAVASGSGSATTFHASTPSEYEMAIRNILPRDLYVMLSINTGALIHIAKVRSGKTVQRKVVAVYERRAHGWEIIYRQGEVNRIMKSEVLRRAAARLRIDDIEGEFRRRVNILMDTPPGYENVERTMKKFYGA